MTSVSLACVNFGKIATTDSIRSNVTRMFREGACFVGACEMGSERKWGGLNDLAPHLVTIQIPDKVSTEVDRVAVVYNSRLVTMRDLQVQQLSEPRNVGKEGAGPTTLEEKWVYWLLLETVQGGGVFWAGMTHLAPSPYLNEPRDMLHEMQLRRVARRVNRLRDGWGYPVAVGGDWNSNADSENMRTFQQESGTRPSRDMGPTFKSGGKLDRWYYTDGLVETGGDVLEWVQSDHNGVMGTFDLAA